MRTETRTSADRPIRPLSSPRLGTIAQTRARLQRQRRAAPRIANGSGSCAEGSPCKITVAVAGAHSGDTVILAGNEGSYGTPGAPLTTELKH